MTESGLQFDDRLWVCGYCKTVCVDYPTMKEHTEKRCRVRQAIRRRKEARLPEKGSPALSPASVLAEGQKALEEWG